MMISLLGYSQAPTTETFETESHGSTSFADNGVVFDIKSNVGTFKVQANFPGTGWSGTANDNRYIDNTNNPGNYQSFSIKTTSNLFKVNRFWMYLSKADLNLNVSGSLTVTGKLSGVTKFTQTKTSGFATSLGNTNGYSLIDLTNLNGQNYANIVIDELVLTLGGGFVYAGLDAFTWVKDSNTIIPIVTLSNQTNVSCNGGSNGILTVSASGGTAPYTYAWSPSGGTSATATGLSAGTYTVTVTDANGGKGSGTYTISQPTVLTATTSQTNVSCNGGGNGTATVTPSGGTTPYTYSWSSSGGTNATATGLAVGTYTCTIKDANGCSTTKSVTITQPSSGITATTSKTDVSCNGGSNGTATVTPSGGTAPYTYSWSPSGGTAATATGLAAGTYTVTITDANACSATRSVTITQPTTLSATASSTNVSCNGGTNGTATVTVSGGTPAFTYSWSPSGGTAATATGLSAGTYTVTITDANACTTQKTVTITQPTAVEAPTGDAMQSFNQDDTLAVLVVNGQNIKWYATQADAQSFANALPSSTLIVNDTTYYATQTVGQCESNTALAVKAYNATLAVGASNKTKAILLYPNPVRDILSLQTDEKIISVDTFGIDGKKLMNKARLTTNNQLDVHNLPQGTYILQVKTETKTEAIKFIKQ